MTEIQAAQLIQALNSIGSSLSWIGFMLFLIMLSVCFGSWK